MATIGYALSSEEHSAPELVRFAQLAEQAGFGDCMISDHFHPWIDEQGNSPFVWSVIGAIGGGTRVRGGPRGPRPPMRTPPAPLPPAAAPPAPLCRRGGFFPGGRAADHPHDNLLEPLPPA